MSSDSPQTKANGAPLSWRVEYDGQGRIAAEIDPAGRRTTFEYHEGAGVVRCLEIKPSEGTEVRWDFDESGHPIQMKDSEGSTSYVYDRKGRLQKVQRTEAPVIAYAYDLFDRKVRTSVGDLYSIDYGYDFLGRLVKQTVRTQDPITGRQAEFPISYDYRSGDGLIIRTLPNGIETRWTHNPIGELQEIVHVDADNFILTEHSYAHDPQGRIASIKERSRRGELTEIFTYDKVGRLTQAARSDGRLHSYTYDLVGNRLAATASDRPPQAAEFDWAGRLASLDGQACRYDAAGNLIALTLNGTALRFRYHADGRLAEAKNGNRCVQYRYDGEGHLIARRSGMEETRFVCDPLSQIWQPLVILEPHGNTSFVVWDGATPLMIIHAGKPEYFLHDHLGSVRAIVDAGGRLPQFLDYDPFGTPAFNGSQRAGLQPGFAGLFWDKEASSYLTLARAYMPQIGCFQQPDPICRLPIDPQKEYSLFKYCGGNPICLVDRGGEAEEWYDHPGSWLRTEDFLASELGTENRKLALSQLLKWFAENGQGRWREEIAHFNLGFKYGDLLNKATETERYLREHPGDPASDVKVLSLALSVLSRLADFSTLGSVTSVLGYGVQLGSAARSRLLLNRSERLLSFGGAVLPKAEKFVEGVDWHRGAFSMRGHGFSAHGGWRLTGSYQGWLGRDRDFEAWAVSRVLNLSTTQGERISGEFSRFEERYERGASLFNLYEPRSLTITRRSHDVYRIRKGGDSILLEEPTTRREIPTPEAPEVLLEGKPPYIHRGEEFPPERRDPFFLPPRRRGFSVSEDPPNPPPAAVAPSDDDDPGDDGGGTAIASPVGGVYLSGFIGAFEGFGTMKGVCLDPNGNLVLLATADSEVKTPPLRLDDVVTVFRSVYLHGEGPTVTIDPASQDPKKAPMIIRHSKATERTYVGWVLYQADRLMKGYMLGTDNITEQEILSGVPGHREVLDTIYFGGGDPGRRQKEGYWERFWIVPAEARRFESPRHELTLFDVPLKVNTQSMKWKRGELVDDLTMDSSPGAKAFTSWFTASYDQIATEQYLMPSPESGLTQPVPVFAELQRIALITAIAEKLRDEGVPIPFWMRDYKVRAVPFETTTPGLQVTRERGNASTRIFGGVNLSPGSRDVKTFNSVTQPADVPPDERTDVMQGVQSAAALEDALSTRPTLVGTPPLRLERIVYQEKEFCALAIPGAATRAVGACRLDEVDLWVPLSDGRSLQLIRHYNSFFAPEGPWGAGWTLDLPRLAEISIPIQRERDSVRYTIARELITPLNSHYARFREQRVVPELGDSRLLVPDHEDGPFYGLASDQPKFLRKRETLLLIRKDGARWHFTSQGDLVALEERGLVTLYDRASDGRITRIVGLLGGVEEAAITLHYDKQGLLDHAEASSASGGSPSRLRVDYEYGSSRRLAGIRSFEERVGYRYEGPWVNALTWQACDGKGKPVGEEIVLRTFAYNSKGQLLEESVGSTTTRHTILAGTDALTVTSTTGERDHVESIRYDSRLRPLESIAANGTHTRWHYVSEGGVEIEITKSNQSVIRMIQSVKARRWTLYVGDAPPLEADYDVAGRLVALNEGGQKLLDQQWRFDGQLAHVGTGDQTASFQYNDSGFLSSVIEHPSAEEGTFNHWQETTYDKKGRPIALANHEGLKLKMAYDASGSLSSVAQKTAKGDMGFDLRRDNQGRLQTVKSSWGDTAFTYDKEGGLRQVVTTRNGRKAQIELEGGALRRRIGFDGGETAFEYYRESRLAGLPREISSPDGLRLKFGYDDRGRLARIRVGQARKVEVTYDEFGRPTAYAWVPVSE